MCRTARENLGEPRNIDNHGTCFKARAGRIGMQLLEGCTSCYGSGSAPALCTAASLPATAAAASVRRLRFLESGDWCGRLLAPSKAGYAWLPQHAPACCLVTGNCGLENRPSVGCRKWAVVTSSMQQGNGRGACCGASQTWGKLRGIQDMRYDPSAGRQSVAPAASLARTRGSWVPT